MKETSMAASVIKTLLISLAAAVISGVIFMLIFAAVAYSASDPDSLVMPLSLASLGISSLACGVVAARMNRTDDLPWQLIGALAGSVMVFFMFILSFVPADGVGYGNGMRALIYVCMILLSVFGSLIGRRRGRRKPKYPVKKKRVRR